MTLVQFNVCVLNSMKCPVANHNEDNAEIPSRNLTGKNTARGGCITVNCAFTAMQSDCASHRSSAWCSAMHVTLVDFSAMQCTAV